MAKVAPTANVSVAAIELHFDSLRRCRRDARKFKGLGSNLLLATQQVWLSEDWSRPKEAAGPCSVNHRSGHIRSVGTGRLALKAVVRTIGAAHSKRIFAPTARVPRRNPPGSLLLKRGDEELRHVEARLLASFGVWSHMNDSALPPIGAGIGELVSPGEAVENMRRTGEDSQRHMRGVHRS
jgi:hypothetical protein